MTNPIELYCRCGKSVLLFDLFYEYLLDQGVQEDHIIKLELDQRKIQNCVLFHLQEIFTRKL